MPAGVGTKRCSTCKETLPISSFNRRRDSIDGYNGVCKSCRNTRDRDARRRPSRKGGSYITVTDAVTPELRARLRPSQWTVEEWDEYDRVLALANDCCEICRDDEPGTDNDIFMYFRDNETFRIQIVVCHSCHKDYLWNREKWGEYSYAWEMALKGWEPYLTEVDAEKRAKREKEVKECNRCHKTKVINDFNHSPRFPDKLSPECSDCTKKYYRAHELMQDDGTYISVKLCNQCETEKEASEFAVEPHSPDGHRNQCKVCHRENAKHSEERKRQRAVESLKHESGEKQECIGCLEVLPIEVFSRDKTKSSGRRNKCKPCRNRERRERQAENRQMVRAA